jgi:hypothetical protein
MRSRLKLMVLASSMLASACGGGGAWQSQTLPATDFAAVGVTAVWAFSPDDVWAGGTTVFHYDGKGWTETPLPDQGFVFDFWGLGPNNLLAAQGKTLIRWDGTAWSSLPVKTVSESLHSILAFASDDVWLGGDSKGEILHWNGSLWSSYFTSCIEVRDLWGANPNDIWAAGSDGLAHWNGTAWQDYPSDSEATSLWGFAADDVWLSGGWFAGVAHWDGTVWKSSESRDFNKIWGPGPGELFGVGNGGLVAQGDGKTWKTVELGIIQFMAVHGSSATNVWIAGYDQRNNKPSLYRLAP